MDTIKIPSFLHDVFGEATSKVELSLIFLFGIGATLSLFALNTHQWVHLPNWGILLLIVIVLDICAGCVANFSRSTNNFYAARRRNRIIFILLHIQPIIISFLLSAYYLPAVFVWLYTLVTASIVNALKETQFQVFAAGLFLATGLYLLTQLFQLSAFLVIIFMLFLLKVTYSFAVDHYATSRGVT